MSEDLFKELINLLYQYTSKEMDQFDNLTFNTKYGPIYVSISREPGFMPIDVFDSVDFLIDK